MNWKTVRPIFQIWAGVILFAGLSLLNPAVTLAGEEVFAGVDAGTIFMGSRFAISANYDLMLTYYEPFDFGSGIYYQTPELSWDLAAKPDYWEASIAGKFGAAYSAYDSLTDQGSTDLALYFGRVKLLGNHYYDLETASDRGEAKLFYDGTRADTTLRRAFDNTTTANDNYSVLQIWKWTNNQLTIQAQDNTYNEGVHGLIGYGQEIFWENQPWGTRVGVGHFDETSTGVEEWRERLGIGRQKEWTAAPRNHYGLGFMAEGFWYESGASRQEATLSSWWQHLWAPGYFKLSSEGIGRRGETPFYFDADPATSWYGLGELEWRGRAHSNFKFKYDILETEWQEAHGVLEWKPGPRWEARFLGDYIFTQVYAVDQSVYLVEFGYQPGWRLSSRFFYNSEFCPIKFGVHYQTNIAQGAMVLDAAFDLLVQDLASLQWSFEAAEFGKWILAYDFNRPLITLRYQWN